MNIISVKGMSIENSLENISFNVRNKSFTNFVIPNTSDSELIAKSIIGANKTDASIVINSIEVDYKNRHTIYKDVALILEDPTMTFLANTVKEEVELVLKSRKRNKLEAARILENLGISHLEKRRPTDLSSSEKRILAIALGLAYAPKILILDRTLSKIKMGDKEHIIKVLKDYIIKNDATILNFTPDMEDSIFSDYTLILIEKKEVIVLDVLEIIKEKEILKSGLKLPFMIDLSLKLKYYDLLDKIILNKEELVNILWK